MRDTWVFLGIGILYGALTLGAIQLRDGWIQEKHEREAREKPTCTVERVTFPASAKECARIHKAIERRIANETT